MRTLIAALAFFSALPLAVAAEAPAPADPPAATAPAQDDQKAARLDLLFAELKAAPTPDEGKVIESKIWLEWLKSGDPKTDALMMSAIFLMNSGVFTKALAILDQVVALNPGYAEGWNKRATIYYYIKLYDKSLADIEKTLTLEPRHFGALSGLGMIMIQLGDKRRALAAFQRAMAVDPVISNGAEVIEELEKAISKDI